MVKRFSSLWRGVLFGTVVLCAAFPSPQHRMPQHNKATVHGQVQTRDGQPLSTAVTVTLEMEDGTPVDSRATDSTGSFEFYALDAGSYILSVRADKFQPYQETLDLTGGWTVDYSVKIVLTPLDKPVVNLATLPSLTDQAAPKGARKEFEKGSRAWRENKPKEARYHLEKAVQEYPCYARAQAALAEVDLAERKVESAEAAYKQAIHCDGTYLDAFYQLARLYLRENKPADSATVLLEGLRLSPNSWIFHYELATAQFALGKYLQAVQDFQTAQSLHPDMPTEFHAKLANAYIKTHEYDKALTEMDTYLRLSPQGPYAASAKRSSEALQRRGVVEAAPQASAASAAKP